jgi:hypothetical protein
MDEAPSPARDAIEDAIACLSWSAMYLNRAHEHLSTAARRLDRQAQIKRNVAHHRNQQKASAPQPRSA